MCECDRAAMMLCAGNIGGNILRVEISSFGNSKIQNEKKSVRKRTCYVGKEVYQNTGCEGEQLKRN